MRYDRPSCTIELIVSYNNGGSYLYPFTPLSRLSQFEGDTALRPRGEAKRAVPAITTGTIFPLTLAVRQQCYKVTLQFVAIMPAKLMQFTHAIAQCVTVSCLRTEMT